MKKRGQSPMEYMMLLVVILGLTIPLLYFSGSMVGGVYRINQIEDSLKSIAITGKAVNNLGKGNSDVVVVSIPKGVDEAYVNGSSMVYILGDKEIKESTDSEFFGLLPTEAGIHRVQIEALGGGVVKLGDVPYIISIEPPNIHIPSWKGDDAIIRGKDFDQVFYIYYANQIEPENVKLMPSSYYTQISPDIIYLNPQHLFGETSDRAYFDIWVVNGGGLSSNKVTLHIYRKKVNDPGSE